MAGKRKGLGKGLGAYFGDDLMMASTSENSAVVSRETKRKAKAADKAEEAGKDTEKDTGKSEKAENGKAVKAEKVEKAAKAGKKAAVAGNSREVSEKVDGKTTESASAGAGEEDKETTVSVLSLSLIEPNREQPRKVFDEEQLRELAESMKKYGVLQPLLVQKRQGYYEIVAGERRWRAAQMAGLREVPVLVRDYTRQKSMEVALIENLQRQDLNPVEEAMAYQQLMEEFRLTQEEIAEKVSKSRAAITNTIRLLKLDARVLDMLIEGKISSGHARALLALEKGDVQVEAAKKIEAEGLSVRDVEKMVKRLAKPVKEKEKEKEPEEEKRDDSFIYRDLEDRMKSIMGTKVSINKKDKNKGRIEIEYYSSAELERIVELIESIQ